MLILIGSVPAAYALNHAVTGRDTADFVAVSDAAVDTIHRYVSATATAGDPRTEITDYVRTRELKPSTMVALQETSATTCTSPAKRCA